MNHNEIVSTQEDLPFFVNSVETMTEKYDEKRPQDKSIIMIFFGKDREE